MGRARHILFNGLSIGSRGGYVVARELARHIASARPDWTLTLVLSSGNSMQQEMAGESLPASVRLQFAPAATAGWLARSKYERSELVRNADAAGTDALVQLNGMAIRGMRVPTLSHFQDPWPYRPEAWDGPRDRAAALLKRRAHATALRTAAFAGFTSGYLRDLICNYHGVRAERSGVFYNGLPDCWIETAERGAVAVGSSDWEGRPNELLSVSHVNAFKRQSLVIRALPALTRLPGLGDVVYRIVGPYEPGYRRELEALADEAGVAPRVVFEGSVPDARVRELLLRAKAFVLMSVCESFGIPAIEAMAGGAPVVTSDCCAMPEVCGDAADLCPPDDLQELVARLGRVLTDPAHAQSLRKRGFERVGRFRWSNTAEAMAAALEEIMR
jgi:glycosyltransferase involved in cell wall biosynthesis